MPRGRGRTGGGRAGPSSPRRETPSPQPTPKATPPRAPPVSKAPTFSPGGMGSTIVGSLIGSTLGSVLGNAISARMCEGRDPDTGEWKDKNKVDTNPCKRELDILFDCARNTDDPSSCKLEMDLLKKCADKNRGKVKGRS
ncbi:coiled-coil-helix-coiled-coil-helix domain-containing protein 2 [Biomphalaria glabrata]|nr:coiled-coil-helix-coiled-coil-helix domain-containing protein 2 [Biomphalaria glabrata]